MSGTYAGTAARTLLATLIGGSGLLTAGTAQAVPTQWLGVELTTGNDDKRDDSYVSVWLTTTYGHELVIGSNYGQRLPDDSRRLNWNRLPSTWGSGRSTIETDQITGCWIYVDLGAGGGLTGQDQWQMNGLRILAPDPARPGRLLTVLDMTGFAHKFTRDGWLQCPPAPVRLTGTFAGTVGGTSSGDFGTSPITLTFRDNGDGTASVDWTVSAGASFECYGTRRVSTRNGMTTGRRTALRSDRTSTWTFSFQLTVSGHTVRHDCRCNLERGWSGIDGARRNPRPPRLRPDGQPSMASSREQVALD